MAVKFPLKMADGAAVRTLKDLREHFDLTTVLSYYDNGRLVKWLENGYYDEEAGKVAALDAASADFAKELCAVLGVERPGDDSGAVDLGRISSRNERLNRLKQYTADDTILAAVDRVAFTQEDLADLLGKGITDVYLYGERFVVPEGFENISIQCVNNPTVTFSKVERLEQAAKQGDTKAQAELARYYQERNNIDSAVEWYVKAVAAGDTEAVAVFGEFDGNPEAQMKIGDCYFDGICVEENSDEAVRWYTLAAKQGHAPAQAKLGKCIMEEIVEGDYDEAIRWYNLAAEQGCAEAQYELGVHCSFGVEKDEAEAAKWYRLAAEQGHAEAQAALGDCYMRGQGVEKDEAEAVKWYRPAAEQGDLIAQMELGESYFDGRGIEKDYKAAEKWYKLAAEQGEQDCFGWRTSESRAMADFLDAYRKATELNDAEAQFKVGQLYLKGVACPVFKEESRDTAIKWFTASAKQGNAKANKALQECIVFDKWYQKATQEGDLEARFELAECYFDGIGVKEDAYEAAKWYRKFAEQDYSCGYSADEDAEDDDFDGEEESVKWCTLAAKQGHAPAQVRLGKCFMEGVGVKEDSDEAVRWYSLAAEQGCLEAQEALGSYYYDEANWEEAKKWYQIAAANGSEDAEGMLQDIAEEEAGEEDDD